MKDAIREALAELEQAEAAYRLILQTAPSADHLDVGRAWDRMRKAGDKARAALAEPVAPPSDCGLTECQGKPMCARCRHQARGVAQPAEPVAPMLQEQPSGDAWGDGYEEGYRAGMAELKAQQAEPVATFLQRLETHEYVLSEYACGNRSREHVEESRALLLAALSTAQPAEPGALPYEPRHLTAWVREAARVSGLWPAASHLPEAYAWFADSIARAAIAADRAARTGGGNG